MSAETCSYEFWLGPRELKYSSSGVERSVKGTPRSAARAVLDTIGVTKVADVTDLDRVGIPNFMTVRPHDRGPGISYYNGKGTTRADAYAGAMMEAIERDAGERYDGPVIDASHYNLRRQHACVDPLEIHISMVRNYSEHLLLEWVLGFDLLTRRPTYAPLNCVVSPYTTFSGMPVLFEYQRSRIAQYPGRCPLPRALRGGRTRCIGAGNGKLAQTRSCGDPLGYRIWWGVSSAKRRR
jgi:YcaO-like protein with predicted kinase domain